MSFNINVYYGAAFALVGWYLITTWLDLGVDDEKASGFTLWLRELEGVRLAVVVGLMAVICGVAFEFYLTEVLWPAITNPGPDAIVTYFVSLLGIGMGLSAGRALTRREYSWVEWRGNGGGC